MDQLTFNPSIPYTIGVELEFQLLDPDTFNLIPKGPELLDLVEPELQPRITAEFIQSMVEINTPICTTMNEVADNLFVLCNHIKRLTQTCHCTAFSSSLHPFARTQDRLVSPSSRYHEIINDLQLSGRRMITQALHVHIGLPDAETTIKVCDGIRPYLPILLALTTSSPFFEQENTGFYSYRTNLFCCLPRTGIPEPMGSWKNFEEIILLMNEATILNGIKELWWDVRPHPDFGTIEIRICDLPANLHHILAMVAVIQALVATLATQDTDHAPSREIINHNKWNAARYGLDGTFIHRKPGHHMSFKKAAAQMLDFVMPQARTLAGASFIPPVYEILKNGTSAHLQKELYAQHHDLKEVIRTLQEEFWQKQ